MSQVSSKDEEEFVCLIFITGNLLDAQVNTCGVVIFFKISNHFMMPHVSHKSVIVTSCGMFDVSSRIVESNGFIH